MNRRKNIKNPGLAGLNFPVFGKNAPGNKIAVSVMGVNGRGAYLAECFSQLPNAGRSR